MAAVLSAIVLGLPDFDTGTSRVRFSQSTCSHLARVTSLRRAPVSSRSMMALAAIWFFSALIEAMRRWVSSEVRNRCRWTSGAVRETCGRVHACARHVPLPCEIENIAQEHQDAIGGRPGVSLGPHVVDQPRYVLTGDLIEGEAPEGGQDVDAQDGFIRLPAPLAGLGMGQIAVADELVERWDGPQFLAASLRVGAKQRLGERRAARPSCLLDGEDVRRAELELTLPAISVEITLVEGLAPRRSDFEQEPFLAWVEGAEGRERGQPPFDPAMMTALLLYA